MPTWTLIIFFFSIIATSAVKSDTSNIKTGESAEQTGALSGEKSIQVSTVRIDPVQPDETKERVVQGKLYVDLRGGHRRRSATRGTIQSANFPSPYHRNSNSHWNILVAPAKIILMSFHVLDTEAAYDYVYLYDGPNERSPLLGKFSGNLSGPLNMCTSVHTMFLHFMSDGSNEYRGFNATYVEVERNDSRCHNAALGYRHLHNRPGTIQSLNFPSPYPPHTEVSWKIEGMPDKNILMSFEVLDTASYYENVHVYDGPNKQATLIGRFFGNVSQPPDMCTSGNTMFIRFTSDSNVQDIGFNATYTEVDRNDARCQNTAFGYRYVQNTWGTIQSLDFPSPYPPNADLSWTIEGTPGRIILLYVEVLNTQSCCDHLYVYDGPHLQATFIGRFSGNLSNLLDICASGNTMFIRFTSNGENQGIGFNATYTEVDRDDGRCQNTAFGYRFLHNTPGTIQSLDFPSPYPPYAELSWKIEGTPGRKILLSFDILDTESYMYHDYVNVYDGPNQQPTLIGRLSGNYSQPPDICTSNIMFISFISNGIHNQGIGFNASYEEVNRDDPRCMSVRLINGSSPDEGRVEVFHLDTWGTICDDAWSDADAQVICRMLGKPSNEAKAYSNALYGLGSGPILLDDVHCLGNETSIDDCVSNGWGRHNCYHSEDAGVVCAETPIDVSTQAAIMNSTDSYEAAITVDCLPDRWNIHMYLPRLYKEHSDFDPSDIYLGRPGCQGYRSGDFLVIDQDYSNCLTHTSTIHNITVYTNMLLYVIRDENYDIIPGKYHFRLPVECDVDLTQDTKQIHKRVRSQHSHISGHGYYNIQMTVFSDSRFLQQLYRSPLTANIGDNIYISVTTTLPDFDFKMRIHNCYTLPSPGAMDFKYYLIRNGCASDVSTHVIYISTDETRFVFRNLEYSSDQNNLYLYCTAVFCNTTDYSSVCDQSCHPSQTRSFHSSPGAYPIWTQASRVIRQSKGRLRREAGIEEERESSVRQQYISTNDHLFIAVILTAVGVSVIGVFVAVQRYRKSKTRIVESM